MDKYTIQMLIEKLDRNMVTLSEAKDWVKNTYNLTVKNSVCKPLFLKRLLLIISV